MSKRNRLSSAAVALDTEVVTAVEHSQEAQQVNGGKSRKKYDLVEIRAEAAQHLAGVTGVSNQIRKLLSLGWERGKVAATLGKLYQHVRNVELKPIKVSGSITSASAVSVK